jgi:hypothetical protein
VLCPRGAPRASNMKAPVCRSKDAAYRYLGQEEHPVYATKKHDEAFTRPALFVRAKPPRRDCTATGRDFRKAAISPSRSEPHAPSRSALFSLYKYRTVRALVMSTACLPKFCVYQVASCVYVITLMVTLHLFKSLLVI